MSGATLYCLPSNSSRPNAHSVLDTSIGPKSWSLQAACVCVCLYLHVCMFVFVFRGACASRVSCHPPCLAQMEHSPVVL